MDLNRTKKIIYISTGVIVLGIIGYFLLTSFLSEDPGVKDTIEGITGRFPGTGVPGTIVGGEFVETPREIEIAGRPEQKLVRLSDFPVVSPSLDSAQKKIRFYKKSGGDLLRADFNGENQERISNLTIVGLVEALWAPSGERAAVFYL